MKVRYTATALSEIEAILTHIAKDNASAALRVSVTILATIDRVVEFPHIAVESNVPGVRVAPVLPYRYLIFFSFVDGVLIIRNVRHAARERSNIGR
jgi:plasmid stabilization system protein ParE